jgi:hypothetical protein
MPSREIRSCDDRRGLGISTSRPSCGRYGRAWTLVLVLLLAAGVIAMHSLGIGHHGAPPATGGSSLVEVRSGTARSPMTGQDGHGGLSEGAATWPFKQSNSSGCTNCSVSKNEPLWNIAALDGRGLMAMCLAVSSVLVLLLRPAWRGWFRPPQRLRNPVEPATGAPHDGPPAGSVSLWRLCVLRT